MIKCIGYQTKGKKSKSECILYNYLKYGHRKRAPKNASEMQTEVLRPQVTLTSLRGNFSIAILNEGNSYRRARRTPYILKPVRVTHFYTAPQTHPLIQHFHVISFVTLASSNIVCINTMHNLKVHYVTCLQSSHCL